MPHAAFDLELFASDDFAAPVDRDQVREVEVALGVDLPAEYVQFVTTIANGGEGAIGDDGYLRLEPVQGLPALQADLEGLDHLGDLVVFAALDGEAYVFEASGEVLMVPMIGDLNDAVRQGPFDVFLRRVARGQLLEAARVYAFDDGRSLDDAGAALGSDLGWSMELRESSFWGGDYLLGETAGGDEVRVVVNFQEDDGPFEPLAPLDRAILYIDGGLNRAEDDGLQRVKSLRRML